MAKMAKPTKPAPAGSSSTPAPASAGSTALARIPWPPLTLAPHAPLPHLDNSLLPGIITIDPLLSRRTVKAFLALLDGPQSPVQLEPSPPAKRGEAVRTNERFSVQDPAFARMLWDGTALKTLLEEGRLRSEVEGRMAKGLNGNIRLYRYNQGSKFNREPPLPGPDRTLSRLRLTSSVAAHYDDYSEDPVTGYRSEWTLLVYLTGAEDGIVGTPLTRLPAARLAG